MLIQMPLMGGRVPEVANLGKPAEPPWISGERVVASGEDQLGRFFCVAQQEYREQFLREGDHQTRWRWPERGL